MSDEQPPAGSLQDDVGDIVGVSIFVVVLVNVGLNAALTWVVQNSGFRGGIVEWSQFLAMYVSTATISLTLTAALAVYAIPRMYGYYMPWVVPPLVIVLGATLAALANDTPWNPVAELEWDSPWVILFNLAGNALIVFAVIFGPEFLSGTITGIGGGLIAIAVTNRRVNAARARIGTELDPARRSPEPWVGGVVMLVLAVVVLAFIIATDLPELISP